jgi:hypothetical protein
MKEGLGDILYFLAMIAFFVISSIAKSKKAKKKVVPPPQQEGFPDENEPANSSNFPWLDDFFQDEEEEIPAQATESGYETVYETPITKQGPVLEEESNITPKRELFKYSEVENSEHEDSYWDEEEFDLRRAIVFSEILKRPEL